MALDNARKFIKDMKENEQIQESIEILQGETNNILALAQELGYDFSPIEFVQAIIETLNE